MTHSLNVDLRRNIENLEKNSVTSLRTLVNIGSSRQLAFGPVALVSLLVSNVLGSVADSFSEVYIELAILLALMVGVLECIMGLLRYFGHSLFSSSYI